MAFAFQASDGCDKESLKSPFEAAVRIKASWLRNDFQHLTQYSGKLSKSFVIALFRKLSLSLKYIVNRFFGSSNLLRRHLEGAIPPSKYLDDFGRLGIGSFPGSLAYIVARTRLSRIVAHNIKNPVTPANSWQWSDLSKGTLILYELPCSVSICSGGRVFKFCKCQCAGLCGFLFLCTSLYILASFCLHHSGALPPVALLSNCSQGLADHLRLNKILTSLNLEDQNMCDEQVKVPAGRTVALGAEGGGVAKGRSRLAARCLTMPLVVPAA